MNGIVVKTGASDNTFHSNKIVNATENGIANFKGDSGKTTKTTIIDGNTFENNTIVSYDNNNNN